MKLDGVPRAIAENVAMPPGEMVALVGCVVITGPVWTDNVNVCVAGAPTPLLAEIVKV